MNFKKTAVATAVGATLAISGVAQAAGHDVSVYGRINNTINMTDKDYTDAAKLAGDAAGPLGDDDESSVNVYDVVSRIGVKASAPINDSLTAFGQYEFSTFSDSEGSGIGDTRVAEVGVRGDGFGSLKIGNMWSTFYNVVGTHMDPTVTLGAVLYSTGTQLPYRVSNAIQYSNSFGMVSLSAEIRLADEDDPDDGNSEKIGASNGNAIGVSVDVTDNLLLAVVVDNSADDPGYAGEDVTRTGLAAKWAMDNWWVSLSWGETSADDQPGLGDVDIAQTQIHAGMSFGDGFSGFVGYGTHDVDVDAFSSVEEPSAVTLNLTKRFGKSGFRVYYEGIMMSDGDDVYEYDQDTHIFGARIDF
jgi:predicted porin